MGHAHGQLDVSTSNLVGLIDEAPYRSSAHGDQNTSFFNTDSSD